MVSSDADMNLLCPTKQLVSGFSVGKVNLVSILNFLKSLVPLSYSVFWLFHSYMIYKKTFEYIFFFKKWMFIRGVINTLMSIMLWLLLLWFTNEAFQLLLIKYDL